MNITANNFPRAISQLINYEQEYNLPQLKGTEKQIKYARDIRQKFLLKVLPHFLNYLTNVPQPNKQAVFNEVNRIRNLTNAPHWIDLYQQFNSLALKHVLKAGNIRLITNKTKPKGLPI